MTVDEAQAALDAADRALSQAVRCMDEEIAAVKARHEPSIRLAKEAFTSAAQALREAESAATPDHEWEGKTVCRTVEEWSGPRWNRQSTKTTERGVVFTYRHGIDLGPGWTWSTPAIGEPMVRLLKKDGKPGVKTVRLKNGGGPWTLETTHD